MSDSLGETFVQRCFEDAGFRKRLVDNPEQVMLAEGFGDLLGTIDLAVMRADLQGFDENQRERKAGVW